ncbi:MFS transporter [Brevibacillus sp. H7]|uniref:MFS transporter n=1 Tax=Brevibacillus sp. H7 TaxID=3349138 RepID=UPI003826E296
MFFLVYLFSYRFNFLFDAFCYFLSLFLLLGMPRLPGNKEAVVGGFINRLREGFDYIYSHTEIKRLFLYQMAERVCWTYYILMMFYVLQERGEGLYVYALLDIPLGLGGVLAGAVVGKLAERLGPRGTHSVLGWSLIMMAASIYFMFHSGPLPVLMVTTLFSAFASFSSSILSMTRLQKLADPNLLARVFSLREMATMGSFSLGCVIAGYGAERFGSAAVATGLALWGGVIGLLWLLRIKPLKEQVEESI